jgi:hypothetical protein
MEDRERVLEDMIECAAVIALGEPELAWILDAVRFAELAERAGATEVASAVVRATFRDVCALMRERGIAVPVEPEEVGADLN